MTPALRWRLAGGFLLAFALLFLFFRGVDWRVLGSAFRSAHPGYLAALILATLLAYLGRAWRWGYLLAPLVRVPLSELFSATIVGFMSGLLIPRAGEVVRPYLIARERAIETSAAFASIILERLADLLTVLLLFGLYLYVLPAPPAQTRGPLLVALKTGGVLVALLTVAVLLLLRAFHLHAEKTMALVDRLLARFPGRLASALSGGLRAFGVGLGVLQASPGHLLAIFGQSMLVWLSIALAIHWNNRAFGLDLPFHSAFLIIGFLTVGVAVPTPGMVGGFHESYLLALTQAFGVDKDTAAAVGIAGHALSNLPVLLLGLWFLGRLGLTVGRVARLTEETAAGRAASPAPRLE